MPRIRPPPGHQSEPLERSPTLGPGAVVQPIPAAQRFAGRGPLGPQDRPGSRANAAVRPDGMPPSKYQQNQPAQPPNQIADVDLDANWFSPFQPVAPFGPPGVTYPREWDYSVGVNLDFNAARFSFFATLRAMVASWGILGSVIKTRKDQLLRIPWEIRLRDVEKPKSVPKRVAQLRDFFRKPDGKMRFDPWMRRLLDDRFIIDAASLHIWPSAAGVPYAVEVIDGATIRPLIDDAGRRPDYPNPAYQQIIKGLPMINLDETELLYAPANPRPQMPIFGTSEVEMILLEVTQGIRKTLYETSFWNEGTLPDLVITVPEAWTPQQIASFQAMFDAMMSGNLAFKSKIRFMPGGMKPFDIKNANGEGLKTDQNEWLTRIVCFVFSVNPQPFVKMMNRATAQNATESAEEEGLHPLMAWVKDEIMDPLIQEKFGFGYDDCEFGWTPEPEVDKVKQMTELTGYVKAGIKTPNEAREIIDLPPDPAGNELIIETATGPVPLAETVEANRQRALAVPDELQRSQETHDRTMATPLPTPDGNAPPGRKPPAGKSKAVGKSAGTPFRQALPAA
jgi:hypothetical protein